LSIDSYIFHKKTKYLSVVLNFLSKGFLILNFKLTKISDNHYQTGDGKFITIACSEPWFFANLCRALDCEDFIHHQTDEEKADEIKVFFTKRFLTRTRDEWFDILSRADVPVSKVCTLDELSKDSQLRHRQMILEMDHPGKGKIKQVGISIKLSDTPGRIKNLGSKPGEDTSEILSELGYGNKEIQQLITENIVG